MNIFMNWLRKLFSVNSPSKMWSNMYTKEPRKKNHDYYKDEEI